VKMRRHERVTGLGHDAAGHFNRLAKRSAAQ
jgi:hypothetical protein